VKVELSVLTTFWYALPAPAGKETSAAGWSTPPGARLAEVDSAPT
jgi:hypothetical protein